LSAKTAEFAALLNLTPTARRSTRALAVDKLTRWATLIILRALMQDVISSFADAQKLAAVGRVIEGTLDLSRSQRLTGLVVEQGGMVRYRLNFGTDKVSNPTVQVHVDGFARLLCQRSLQAFDYPLQATIDLGFIAKEADEGSLMPGFDPILLGENPVTMVELVEDELILMIPGVAVNPASLDAQNVPLVFEAKAPERSSPFANLSQMLNPLKKN
jgi:uncharacterized protein